MRAKQYYSDDHERTHNMGILLHGDGAFSGQVGTKPEHVHADSLGCCWKQTHALVMCVEGSSGAASRKGLSQIRNGADANAG